MSLNKLNSYDKRSTHAGAFSLSTQHYFLHSNVCRRLHIK